MKTNIGISEKNRQEVTDLLSKLLVDEVLLYTKTQRAHWNLAGHNFHTQHLFFEEHYNALKRFTDSVAERNLKVGNYAPATMGYYWNQPHTRNLLTGLIQEDEDRAWMLRANIAKA